MAGDLWALIGEKANWECGVIAPEHSPFFMRPYFNSASFQPILLSRLGLGHVLVDEKTKVDVPFDPSLRPFFTYHPQWVHKVYKNFTLPWLTVEMAAFPGPGDTFAIDYTLRNGSDQPHVLQPMLMIETALGEGRSAKLHHNDLVVPRAARPSVWEEWCLGDRDIQVAVNLADVRPLVTYLLESDEGGQRVIGLRAVATLATLVPPGDILNLRVVLAYGHEPENLTKVLHQAQALSGDEAREEIRSKWDEWFRSLPILRTNDQAALKAYYKAWMVLRTNDVNFDDQRWILSSLTRFRSVWHWDTSLFLVNALLSHNYDPHLAQHMLMLQFASQRPNGYIPFHILSDDAERITIMPPFIADGSWRVYQATRDMNFAQQAYRKLDAHYRWLTENRDPFNYGLWLLDDHRAPYFYGPESGMDDSPIYDDGTKYPIVLNAAKFLFEQAMAAFSHELGLDASSWERRAALTRDLMQDRMWDEELGYFLPLYPDGKRCRIKTSDGFFALYAKLATPVQARRIAEVLRKEFLCQYGLRSTVATAEAYADSYWRGPVWPCMNYIATEGLRHYRIIDLAEEIERASVLLVNHTPGIYECYVPETGEPARTKEGPLASSFITFGAAALVLMLQNLYDVVED